MTEKFELTDEYIALCNLLKVCGIAPSGGTAKMLVAAGEVEVDGVTELRKSCKIRAGQRVTGNGFTIDVIASSNPDVIQSLPGEIRPDEILPGEASE
jgi:ribosome-associated protein